MIKIIRGDDWCKVIDNGILIYVGHNMNDALEAYLDYHDIKYENDWMEEYDDGICT